MKLDIGHESHFFLPHLHWTPPPPVGSSPSDYCDNVLVQKKLEWCGWLPDGDKFLIENMFTRFDRIHERDGQTDGQTPHDGIGRDYA